MSSDVRLESRPVRDGFITALTGSLLVGSQKRWLQIGSHVLVDLTGALERNLVNHTRESVGRWSGIINMSLCWP